MENDGRAATDLDAIAEARAAIVRRSRTPGWYFWFVGVLVALFVLTIGLGTGSWWYLPAIAVVLVAEGIIIGAHRRVTGASVPVRAWPAWLGIWSAILAAAPVLTAVALHFLGAPAWSIVVLAIVGGIVAGVGSVMLNRRWEASRIQT